MGNTTKSRRSFHVVMYIKCECIKLKLDTDGPIKREILGEEILKQICFPVIKENEMDVVITTNIVTEEEARNICDSEFPEKERINI